MKIVLATGNQGKVRELAEILGDLEVQVLSLKDFPEIGEIIEDGLTFEENAVKKAIAVMEATGLTALADDSGLEVDALDGAPGIYSARFAGEGKNDMDNNLKLLSLMKEVPDQKRTARFRCVIAISTPCGELYTSDGSCEGVIGHEVKGDKGFGYDPLFYLPEYGRTFAELDSDIKNRVSHRGRALVKAKNIMAGIIERVEMEQCGLG
ncbi:MAG: non-canonical purine NTP pyrophosphatase [Firmicutes bacterium HGW-Firmicutes-14]|nr:MAG: non-canonical purine NTP pyrophosphatase [Firmicutes bacterium HGW-Firmicutes-14]